MEEHTNKEIHSLGLLWRGAAIGVAEAIPGVSGGTIAFITGIYERLIGSISNVTKLISQPGLLLRPAELWKLLDGGFLLFVILGMLTGLVGGVFSVSWLLETYPEPLWGFFLGLIVMSSLVMWRDLKNKSLSEWIALAVGIAIGLFIVTQTPAEGSRALPMIFLGGALAITALILPGISGSFILLLLGLYSYVIPLVKSILSGEQLDQWPVLAVFAAGCATGLLCFSRALKWLFERYRSTTLALMIGFMIGSCYKLWPWRRVELAMHRESGSVREIADGFLHQAEDWRILAERPVWPTEYPLEPHSLLTGMAALLAVGLIVFMRR